MAYDAPAGDPPNPGAMMDHGAMHENHMEGGMLHIGPDMLPKGMKLNKGDIVEFKVTGDQDADGDWPIEYNHGDKGEEEKGESWEEGLMKHMSPRYGGEEGQQEAY